MVGELSVRDNACLFGALYGLDQHFILGRLSEILSWAELDEFADSSLRTLSKGMATRLAFSISRYIRCEIMLIDEALTAGDRNFRKKSEIVLKEQLEAGRTFLIATHNLTFLRHHCSRVIWLHRGKRKAFGPTAEVLDGYEAYCDGGAKAKDQLHLWDH